MGFSRQVLFTYLVRVVLVPLGALNGVIIARWLGPSGQGVFATIGAYIATAGMLAGLGLGPAVTNAVAANPRRAPGMVANARWTGLVTGLLALAGLLLLRSLLPGAFEGIEPALLLVAGVALPFSLASSQFQAVVLGLRRIRAFNLMETVDRVLLLAASLSLLVAAGLGVTELVAATAVIAATKFIVCHFVLGPTASRVAPDWALLKGLTGISLRAYVTMLLSFLVLRSDIMLINALRGSADTGVYSVAVQIAELLMVLPAAIGTLLFPAIAATRDEASAHFTAAVHRHAVVAVSLGCVIVALGARWIVSLLFGAAYGDSTTALLLLLPGIWCLSLQIILANDLAGRDYPAFLPLTWSIVLSVNVGFNLIWIPRFGIAGAAASSSVAYSLSFALVLGYWLRRFPDVRLTRLFLIGADELRGLPRRIRNAMGTASDREGDSAP